MYLSFSCIDGRFVVLRKNNDWNVIRIVRRISVILLRSGRASKKKKKEKKNEIKNVSK